MLQKHRHPPGMPIRDYVRGMLAERKIGDYREKTITIYGIKIPLERTLNKTVARFYSSVEYKNLVALGGHPSLYTPYHTKRNTCTTYSTST